MPEELQELKEHAEEGGHDPTLAPITVTMAILAVLVAAVSLLGHRAHTEVLLFQTKASDQWAYYQAKSIRQHSYEVFLDELSVFGAKDPVQAGRVQEKYSKELERYRDEQKEIQAEARKSEEERDSESRRANRFDLGEGLLEASLVITSITLLTRKKFFWGLGMLLGAIGLAIAATEFLVIAGS
jgi:hypothetical protein